MVLENSSQRIDVEYKASAEQRLYSTGLIGSMFNKPIYSKLQYKQDISMYFSIRNVYISVCFFDGFTVIAVLS